MDYKFLSFNFEQKVLNTTLSNCGPLSAIIVWGIPNRHMMFFQTKFVMSLSLMLA